MSKPTDHLTDRELLEAIYQAQQNDHKRIKKIHNWIKAQNIFGMLRWAIYIGVAIGLYTFLQPVFSSITDTYRSLQEGAAAISEFRSGLPW